MDAFQKWLAGSPLASALRTFAAVVLSLAVADWSTGGAISVDNWQAWVIAACASALPVVLRWLNPADTAFGKGKARGLHEPHDIFGEDD